MNFSHLKKNWKTTILGLLAGVGMMAQQRMSDPTAPPFTLGNVIPGLAVIALGSLAKDGDQTGV